MTHQECKSLDEHLAEKVGQGLVDIKFFVKQGASSEKVCSEAASIFDAIHRGAVEEYRPNDSNRVLDNH
jgi:hypothetical protein